MTSCPYTHTPSLWPRAPPLRQGPAPQPQNPTPTPRPHPQNQGPAPPWQRYLTLVAALTGHTRFAQATPTTGITGLRPTRGAVTPCRRVAVTVALTPTQPLPSHPGKPLLGTYSTRISILPQVKPPGPHFSSPPCSTEVQTTRLPAHRPIVPASPAAWAQPEDPSEPSWGALPQERPESPSDPRPGRGVA